MLECVLYSKRSADESNWPMLPTATSTGIIFVGHHRLHPGTIMGAFFRCATRCDHGTNILTYVLWCLDVNIQHVSVAGHTFVCIRVLQDGRRAGPLIVSGRQEATQI